jgi:hypothetical protein
VLERLEAANRPAELRALGDVARQVLERAPSLAGAGEPKPAELGHLVVDPLVATLGAAVGERVALLTRPALLRAELADRTGERLLFVCKGDWH